VKPLLKFQVNIPLQACIKNLSEKRSIDEEDEQKRFDEFKSKALLKFNTTAESDDESYGESVGNSQESDASSDEDDYESDGFVVRDSGYYTRARERKQS